MLNNKEYLEKPTISRLSKNENKVSSDLLTISNLSKNDNELYVADSSYSVSELITISTLSTKDMSVYTVHLNKYQTLVIESGRIDIEDYEYENRTDFEKVIIPDSVTKINEYAFHNCINLKEIVIPNSVSEIGDYVFSGCTNLEKVVLPDSLEKIGEWAFSDCINLKEISIPNSVNEIGYNTFNGCQCLKNVKFPNSVTNIVYTENRSNSEIEEIKIPYSVTIIGNDAFEDFKNLKRVVLPETLKEIRSGAFDGCSKLENINIPDSIIKIGNLAFYACVNLRNIILPKSLKEIGNLALCECEKLEQVVIPECVTEIGEETFASCTNLKEVVVSGSVNKIDDLAFYDNPNLEKIVISNSVKEFGEGVFNDSPKVVIYCDKGSIAEKYAIDNKLKYVIINQLSNNATETNFSTVQNQSIKQNLNSLQNYNIGDILTIGKYKGYPLEWIILEKKDNSIFVISKNAVDKKEFTTNSDVLLDKSWKNSTIRSWLNNDFINNAFSSTEKQLIRNTDIKYIEKAQSHKAYEAYVTDKLFLLSNEEAEKYFHSNEERKAKYFNGSQANYFLRSPGNGSGYVVRVKTDGSISNYGDDIHNQNGIRPSFWIELSNYNSISSRNNNVAKLDNASNLNKPSNKDINSYKGKDDATITELVIEDNVQEIGIYAYFNCKNLSKVQIPNSVKKIGYGAFLSCPKIVIYCDKGSTAEKYAIDNKLKYVINGKNDTSKQIDSTKVTSNIDENSGAELFKQAMFYFEDEKNRDDQLGQSYLKKSFKKGYIGAQIFYLDLMATSYNWTDLLVSNTVKRQVEEYGINFSEKTFIRMLKETANTGNPKAQGMLGYAGIKLKNPDLPSYTQSIGLLEKAAEQSGLFAICKLMRIYYKDKKGKAFDYAYKLEEISSKKNEVYYMGVAALFLGLCYKNGIGVSKSRKQAKIWFEQGKKRGNSQAGIELGHYLF